MRVFVTGATGFIGSAVVADLIAAGHRVLGLTRSEAGAQALTALGAEAHRGSLEDLDSLRSGAAKSDGVIHTAFNHDFSTYVANCEDDRVVIEALGAVLAGSARPLIITSGTGMGVRLGELSTEEDAPASAANVPRAASEEAATAVQARGVNVSVVRLPQVHDTAKQGLVTYAIDVARETGVSAYIADGANRWPAAHRFDVARLYRLALERGQAGARYNAVAEEGVPMRAIAETIGKRLGLPVKSIGPSAAPAHFGWMAMFAGGDSPASSALTRQWLDWEPTGPGLLTDLQNLQVA